MKLLKIVEKKIFLSFEYRCAYDIKFTNLTNNEEIFLPIGLGFMESKSEYYGLIKKKCKKQWFCNKSNTKINNKSLFRSIKNEYMSYFKYSNSYVS